MNKKIVICIILILILSIFIVLIRRENDKKMQDDIEYINNVIKNEITGTYEVYDENENLIYNTEDEVEAEIYNKDNNFDMQMPEF